MIDSKYSTPNCFSEMSIVRLKQGGKYLAMEDRKFKLVDSETACADMEQFVMTMDKVNQLTTIHSFI